MWRFLGIDAVCWDSNPWDRSLDWYFCGKLPWAWAEKVFDCDCLWRIACRRYHDDD